MEGGRELFSFSACGQLLAVGQRDGEVKVWETGSGTLKQRFCPGGARPEPAKFIAWCRLQDESLHKKRKRKSHQLLAVAVGSKVVIWSFTKGEEEKILDSSHSAPVNGVSWAPGNTRLYTGSSDQHVGEWDLKEGVCESCWKADRHGIECVCCSGSGALLLTAGRNIKLWNLQDHTLVKKFTGHATSVRQLWFVSDSVFLSCAENDRVINIWHADGSHGRTAAAALTCDEEVTSFDIILAEESIQLVAVSGEGNAHLFSFPVTNQITAPVTARCTIQFVSTASKGDTPSPLPVLAVGLSPSGMCVAHSNSLRPTFETLPFSQQDRRVCLVREDKKGLLLGTQHNRDDRPSQEPPVTVLGPGNMTLPSRRPVGGSPPKAVATADEPMVNRIPSDLSKYLQAKGRGQGGKWAKRAVQESAESLVHLLVQGVHGRDWRVVERVLQEDNEKVIRRTTQRLPVTIIIPLLQMIISKLESRPHEGIKYCSWIRAVLVAHTAYLMTVPQLLDSLSGLYQLLDARASTFSKLCRLQGKLELVLAQVAGEEEDGDGDKEGARGTVDQALLSVTAGEDAGLSDSSGSAVEEEDWEEEEEEEEEDEEEDGNQSDLSSVEEMEADEQNGELT